MSTLLVGYDLNQPGQDYTSLIETLKKVGAWWHYLDSMWLVKTSLTPIELRDKLSAVLDSSDELVVLDVTSRTWAATGLPKRAYDWLHTNL